MMSGRRIPLAGLWALPVRAAFWTLPLAAGVVALVGVAGWSGRQAMGQVQVRVPAQQQELADNVFLPAPRATLLRLAEARELLKSQRFGEAVRNLGAILDAQEDFFFQPDRDEPIHRSLKAEAQRLIGAMPPGGREVYELQYGPQARAMLSEALSAGDVARLAEISRRFFHTSAGYEATFLLGAYHLDHGRPLAAALTFQRLGASPGVAERFEPALSLATAAGWLQAGAADRASAILAELKESRKGRPVQLGGRDVDWFAARTDAAEWLTRYVDSLGDTANAASQWLLVRGAPHRNGLAAGGAPLMNLRWEVPVADDPAIEHLLAQQRQYQIDQGAPPVPELHPLVVDDVVLMRTTRNLLAVDLHTGKRLWEVPVDDPMESLAQAAGEDQALRMQLQGVGLAFGERVLQDRTFGTLSSDGRQVYSVEDLMPATGIASARQLVRGPVRVMPGQPQPYNRLAAHEIRTGKLKWHLGGPSDEFALRMAETFFLGPPLPLQGQLFALAEAKDEIRLLAIDATTGGLLWAQPLAVVEQGVLYSPVRRLSGLSPAYADGILICPTSAGALVAVDLATRSLLWGYRYSQSLISRQRTPFLGVQFGRNAGQMPGATSWTDPNPIVVDGRVLFTPTDSDLLYCLDLADGRPRWTVSRDDDLYVACVYRGSVILVGRQGVRAIGLADGKPAWEGRTLEFADGGMPSGYGFYTGSHYLVPLSTAEIAVIDLERGRTTHIAHSRRGQIPGNLVGYQGMVLSQSIAGVAAFDQLDVLRGRVADRLAANPDDAEALALRGELLLDEGKRDEAIESLSRSYGLAAERRTASLLREALLDGFRNDFEAFEGRVAEIGPLLDGPQDRAEFLRVMAEGTQHAGRWREAFAHLLQLADLDAESRRLEPVDRTLSVRGDRWVRARMAMLRTEAAGEDATEIDRLVAARMQEALAANSIEALRRFLDYFGDDATAAPARGALVDALAGAGKLLDAEMVLWGSPGVVDVLPDGSSLARMAAILKEASRDTDAQAAYRFLADRHADAVCLDGLTGREILAALPEGHAARPSAERDDQWPQGRIDVQEIVANRPPTQGRYTLDFRGDPGPFFRGVAIRLDQGRRAISAVDGCGQVLWTLPLIEPDNPHSFRFIQANTYVRACGHVLVVSLGSRIVAVDTLGQTGRGQPRVLWSRDASQGGYDQATIRLGGPAGAMPLQGVVVLQQEMTPTDSLGPVTPRYVCFQHLRNVIAVDTLSGETLWVRHGVAPGAILFGDNEVVLAASPQQSDILVLSAVDGSLIGHRSLPAPERFSDEPDDSLPAVQQRFGQTVVATLGRRMIVSFIDPADGRHVLGLFDPLEQRYVWGPIRSDIGKLAHTEELICLLASDGTLRLIRTADGKVIVDENLPGEAAATEVYLLRSGAQYLVATNRPQQRERGLRINPLPGMQYRPIGIGRMYAFDADGNSMWPKPAKIDGELLVLSQPEGLPVFAFAGQLYDPQKNGADRFAVQVMCLDKRNGRIIYRGSFAGPAATFEMVGDPTTDVVEIQLQRNIVKLQMTDQPMPPEEPEPEMPDDSEQAESGPVPPGKAVLNAIGGAVLRWNVFRDPADVVPQWERIPDRRPVPEPPVPEPPVPEPPVPEPPEPAPGGEP